MLATSPAFEADDLEAFRKEAERVTPSLSGGWIVLADETGQQLLNLAPGPKDALPRRVGEGMRLQRQAFETGEVQISGVFSGALLKVPTVTVEMPVSARTSRRSKSSSACSLPFSSRCSSNGTCPKAGSSG